MSVVAWPASIIVCLVVLKIWGDIDYRRFKRKLDTEQAEHLARIRTLGTRNQDL